MSPDCEYASAKEPPKLMEWSVAVSVNGWAANVITDDDKEVTGPVFPAASNTAPVCSTNWSVPSWHCVTTTFIEVPDEDDGVNTHPSAVPELEKSADPRPVTDSLNDNSNVNDIAAAGDAGWEENDAVGGSTSMDIVVEVAEVGPNWPVTVPVTDWVAKVSTTEPDDGDADERIAV